MPGQRGRPRKSVEQHKLEGTYEPGRHGGRGVEAPGQPVMPKGFTKHKRWLWKAIVEGIPKECFGSIDTVALAAACELWDVWQRHKDEDVPQRYYKGLASLKQCMVLLSKFGFTPSDRSRLMTPTKSKDDEDNRFFGVAG